MSLGRLWPALAGAAVGLALTAGGLSLAYRAGVDHGAQRERAVWAMRQAKAAEGEARAAKAVLARVDQLARDGQAIAAAYLDQARAERAARAQIQAEIPHALTPETDAGFPLPWGLVRLHDSAAAGVLLPASGSRPDADASDVAASEAADVIGANYAACRETAAGYVKLQAWARLVSATGPPSLNDQLNARP